MKLKLSKKHKQYISQQMASGRYSNVDELFSEAILIHSLYLKEKNAYLEKEILKGWDGPDNKITIQDLIDRYKAS
ncbi:ribbon-helix-helix domain-containing protein [Zobellia russellii]|uniref:ribbon-helix-helix domain-containing protein n=1 Tax=Zobellia russellii TaxID=248907 RepID=UPI001BFF31EF|nr:type II toxin-antitoxin system ParD family antitoxin [Zobellia russellii]MBT9187753.1 type II toxin-antitoxin system ParD family antitoxin [Zobellia russellii]